ncbi:alpha/beta hydrolase [Cryobacterium melibiosiphilum]|uniref:Alpha/beta hydrolase n=1 Tax=Cryobacterium melibiosiphilum TaxID=995039 RepID=A0A3A5MBR6_9MICO|nr:alpha/beta hydrolase [Cryobacterium melibiosiphilum]RJT86113.1 alpha/beta hydrolase [Cryobacterium melibiosiphilum]
MSPNANSGTETDAAALLAAWPHVYREGAAERPVLLMLHGTGGTEHDLLGLADALDPAAAVIAPRGRVTENGMNRWFRRLAEGVFDLEDVEVRADELVGFVTAARAQYGLGHRPVVAVGFSNGANVALATALRHPSTVARVIAFSGMHPLPGRDATAVLSGTSVLLLNGESDPMAPLPSVDALAAELEQRGARVRQVRRSGGHGVTEADVYAAQGWLAS